jgi:uncharacterized membrane protein
VLLGAAAGLIGGSMRFVGRLAGIEGTAAIVAGILMLLTGLVRFHAWQSIFLNVAAIVFYVALAFVTFFTAMLGMFYFLHLISMLIWLAWFLIWVFCVVKALNGERFRLPVIGDLAAKQAGS